MTDLTEAIDEFLTTAELGDRSSPNVFAAMQVVAQGIENAEARGHQWELLEAWPHFLLMVERIRTEKHECIANEDYERAAYIRDYCDKIEKMWSTALAGMEGGRVALEVSISVPVDADLQAVGSAVAELCEALDRVHRSQGGSGLIVEGAVADQPLPVEVQE